MKILQPRLEDGGRYKCVIGNNDAAIFSLTVIGKSIEDLLFLCLVSHPIVDVVTMFAIMNQVSGKESKHLVLSTNVKS